MTKFELKAGSDGFTALAETERRIFAKQELKCSGQNSRADNCGGGAVRSLYTLSAHPAAVLETMKASLHRFVRICPPSCCADRLGIRLIPDCGADLLQRTDLFGFVAQTKCLRQSNMQKVSPRN